VTGERWMPSPDGTAELVDCEEMRDPVRCARCSTVYDLAHVVVIDRYADCSTWRCPGCGSLVDDRGETGWKLQKDYYRLGRR